MGKFEQIRTMKSFVLAMVVAVLAVTYPTAYAYQCFPDCHWLCNEPTCPAKCLPQCMKPQCEHMCQELPVADCMIRCEKPECEVRCIKKNCPGGGCPRCENVCLPAKCQTVCVPPKPKCKPKCTRPSCQWICHRPTDCAKPKCLMKCDKPKEKTTSFNFRQAHTDAKQAEDCNVKDGDKCCPCTDQRNLQVALEIANSAHFRANNISNVNAQVAHAEENFPAFLELHDEMHFQSQKGNPHGQCCPCAMK